jgi:23S rRNA (pseudouridine1915-N3)-methyltransferase
VRPASQIKWISNSAILQNDNKALQSLIDDYTNVVIYIKFDLEVIPDIKNVKHLKVSKKKEAG